MPRCPRLATGDLAYHVLNRRVWRLPLFEKPADYASFECTLAEVQEQPEINIVVYCLMLNHWHLLLWPRPDGDLSEVLHWITATHTQRWHTHHRTAGTGPMAWFAPHKAVWNEIDVALADCHFFLGIVTRS